MKPAPVELTDWPARVRTVLARELPLDETLAELGITRRKDRGRSVSGWVFNLERDGELVLSTGSAGDVWTWLREQSKEAP